ncbi:DUF3592 domain-containing protein [uncultured Paraglaciecola sp.]|uniref:DUF3592 domain-containing protein n=1 Tax=uncultured Paraglaciecola sp. TaxID=1765024 RepID=UPI002637BAC9|nr:DUF3592 domain-containing protein [uncultured Paraglaciecola sp.]
MFDYIQQMWELALQGKTQGVWFWAAFYTFTLCSYSVIFQLLVRTWPSTTGQLIHSGVEKLGAAVVLSDQNYQAGVLYSYQVQGKTYQGKRISPWVIVASHNAQFVLKKQLSKIDVTSDGRLSIYYKPSNPEKSWLILPSKLGVFVTVLIGLLPAFGFWLEFYG